MKIKKIITSLSCAALIAAAALPLSACGGAKPFEKTDLDIKNYAKAYEPSDSSSYYSKAGITEATTVATDVTEDDYNSYLYSVTKNDGSNTVYSYYNAVTGKHIVDSQAQGNLDLGYARVAIPDNSGDQVTYTVYGGDGTVLFSDAIVSDPDYISGSFVFVNGQYYVGDDDEKSDVLSVTNGDKTNYFVYDGYGALCTYTKVEANDIKLYHPVYGQGSAMFAEETRIADYYDETETGALTGYSFKFVGNEMVFFKAGEETGRINFDGVGRSSYGFAFVDGVMLYTKTVNLPEGSKDANVITSTSKGDNYISYELHSYSIVDDKDKKLDDHGVMINSFMPVYNYSSKTYDAVAISGYKLDGKKCQYNAPFQYIVTSDLKIGFDATNVINYGSQLVDLGDGNYAVQSWNSLTPVNNKLEPLIDFGDEYPIFYDNEKLFRFYDPESGNVGFADLSGRVVIEPIYASFNPFYGGRMLATNTVTGEEVILSSDGKETPFPKDVIPASATEKRVDVESYKGWYTVSTYDPNEETDKHLFEIYNYNGEVLSSYVGAEEMQISPVSYDGKLLKVVKPGDKIDLIVLS